VSKPKRTAWCRGRGFRRGGHAIGLRGGGLQRGPGGAEYKRRRGTSGTRRRRRIYRWLGTEGLPGTSLPGPSAEQEQQGERQQGPGAGWSREAVLHAPCLAAWARCIGRHGFLSYKTALLRASPNCLPSQPASQPAIQSLVRPAKHLVTHISSQPASQPASSPSGQPHTCASSPCAALPLRTCRNMASATFTTLPSRLTAGTASLCVSVSRQVPPLMQGVG